jgi:hypothetical protein
MLQSNLSLVALTRHKPILTKNRQENGDFYDFYSGTHVAVLLAAKDDAKTVAATADTGPGPSDALARTADPIPDPPEQVVCKECQRAAGGQSRCFWRRFSARKYLQCRQWPQWRAETQDFAPDGSTPHFGCRGLYGCTWESVSVFASLIFSLLCFPVFSGPSPIFVYFLWGVLHFLEIFSHLAWFFHRIASSEFHYACHSRDVFTV